MLEEQFIVCPYCGKKLYAQIPTPPPVERKKRSKLRWGVGIILGIILIFVVFSVLSYMRSPVRIELVDKDANFMDDSVELTVILKNTGILDANVTVKFKTLWDQMSDTETKEIVIPWRQSRTVSAILNANPSGVTTYEVTWLARATE